MDYRKALTEGSLLFTKGKKYVINREIGRGNSCIVYEAFYKDEMGSVHNIRLKECYPYGVELHRNENFIRAECELENKKFEVQKAVFQYAYEKSTEIQNEISLINSTVNSTDIIFYNNTIYVAEHINEGVDYGKIDFEPVCETLTRIKALSLIIKKYHEYGYLHLNIRPENILILPETMEQIILLNFDSVVSLTELREEKGEKFFYTEEYCAPELKQKRTAEISFATDIYEIGALAYYKLFGKAPGINESKQDANFDFNLLVCKNEKYQPKLYRELEKFFRKTLSSPVGLRWQNMDEVIEALNRLIKLSDLSKTFLYDNFNYNENIFIGRENELKELGDGLNENKIVFLHGIGGIGKSETAKKFLKDNRESFETILVLNFKDSVKNTILSPDVELGNFSWDKNENQDDFYKRKLRVLQQTLQENDIVFLDNFDVENDKDLKDLFNCKCKFIVTSREDYKNHDYFQIEINEMQSYKNLTELFYAYNQTVYSEEEQTAVRDIINFVDRHTMTVELTAKYLRLSGRLPSEALADIKSLEGITDINDLNVKHRKDRQLRSKTVDRHLLSLFNIFRFSHEEQTVIKSLSLLGNVMISRNLFTDWCGIEVNNKAIERLINGDWIKYENGKVYLHQIILDLVYNHLNPTSESCPAIVFSMTKYISADLKSYTQREVRNHLIKSFAERLEGHDQNAVDFYINYNKNIDLCEEYVKKALAVCEENKDENLYRLAELYNLAAACCFKEYDFFFDYDEEVLAHLSEKIINYSSKAIQFAEIYFKDCKKRGEYIYKTAKKLKSLTDNLTFKFFYLLDESSKTVDKMYDFIADNYKKAEKLFLINEKTNSDKLKDVYRSLLELYSGDIFSYTSKFYKNNAKTVYYKFRSEEYTNKPPKNKNHIVIDSDSPKSYIKIAEEIEGEEPLLAIELLKKEIEENAGSSSYAYTFLLDLYIKVGEKENAVKIVEETFKYWKVTDRYIIRIIDLYAEENNLSKAAEVCEKGIDMCCRLSPRKLGKYNLSVLLDLYGKKAELLEKQNCRYENIFRAEWWQKAVSLYNDNEKVIENADCFFEEYIKYLKFGNKTETLLTILIKRLTALKDDDKIEAVQNNVNEIMSIAVSNEKYIVYAAKACILLGDFCGNRYIDRLDMQIEQYLFAEKITDEYNISDVYIKMLIYKKLAEAYRRSSGNEIIQRKYADMCDYYLLAEHDAVSRDSYGKKDLWKEAVNSFIEIKKYDEAEKCFKRLFELYDAEGCYVFSVYCYDYENRIDNILKKGDFEYAENLMSKLFYLCLNRYFNEPDSWEFTLKSLSDIFKFLSEKMIEMKRFSEAAAYRIFSAFTQTKAELDKDFYIYEKETNKLKNTKELLNEVLSQEANEDNIDCLLDLCSWINNLNTEEPSIQALKQVCSDYIVKNKYKHIDFKYR